jgi:hypothetical protein
MTALQLNAELYRAMGEIADDETLLAKVLEYVRSIIPTKSQGSSSQWADRYAGAWKDNRSTEEIVGDIRNSRTTNSREIVPR